ncbi:chromosome replication/partitioning protein [Borreliella burgdorferi]|uniref:chromosome replication/partitioning protein n=1 Tax=Borreliella TaxID=64895 RepID=UPI001E56E92C|nr:chromosome replication/partitioning protein [Borreliella burgdorferi]MCD2410007.1 chromosome replication/partitioning protein [Borreliella burgdorferi]MCD2415935.1 chromosome replication/partitioning protein [Borreliella burgdorferi]
MEKKKENKNQVTLYKRVEISTVKELNLDNNQDEEFRNYNELKEQLKLNLKSDINNKIQRMRILHEIKKKELYKYDGFKSFKQFINSYVIARSQAYMYLKIYEKVLEGVISIEKVKEMGFVAAYKNVLKNDSSYIYREKMIGENIAGNSENQNMSIVILIKDKKVYDFCKKDTERISFILERLIKDKKNILSDIIIEYKNHHREDKKKK